MPIIPLTNLAISFIPVLLVIVLLVKWSLDAGTALYSIIRMLVQLIIIGYLLVFIFESQSLLVTAAALIVMVTASSWIALRSIPRLRVKLFCYVVLASLLGGGSVLVLTVWPILQLRPIFNPQYVVPLAGIVFANTMNTISLALERLDAELKNNSVFARARNIAFQAALIPVVNTMFAVGIVSLPGMMTGQILSGVSPLIAVRYQIVIMCIMFASSAISVACLLVLAKKIFINKAGAGFQQ